MIERRKFRRFKTRTDILAETGPYSAVVGQIIDVSIGGLSFRYIDSGVSLKKHFKLNLWVNNEIYLDGICVKAVSDFKTACGNKNSSITIRRAGLMFWEPLFEQLSMVKNIIQLHTAEAVWQSVPTCMAGNVTNRSKGVSYEHQKKVPESEPCVQGDLQN